MNGYVKLLPVANLPENGMKRVTAGGREIAVFRLGGEIFATDDTCTHSACSLAGEGFIDGGSVVCGCHGGTFDVRSGKATAFPATTDLTVYETEVKDGDVYIRIG